MTIHSTDSVLVLDEKGEPIGKFHSVKGMAQKCNVSQDTIKHYIKTGKRWKKHNIYLDITD